MADRSHAISQKERRLGGLSLLSLAAAVVGFVNTVSPGGSGSHSVAGVDLGMALVVLRIIFLLLAVLLGFFGRRSRSGRFGLIGSGTLLGILLVVILFLVSRHAPSVVHSSVPLPPQ
jgi:hypothetical protein